MTQPRDDDPIRTMLEARAERATVRPADVDELLATARQRALASPRAGSRVAARLGLRPIAAGSASVLAAALVVVLVALPLANRPATSPSPSPPPTASGASSSGPPPTVSPEPSSVPVIPVVTAADLAPILAERPDDLVGRTLAVEGSLVTLECAGGDCPVQDPTILWRAPGMLVRPVGDIGPGPWDGSGPINGTFALTFTGERTAEGHLIADYLDRIEPAEHRLAWSPEALAVRGPWEGLPLTVVQGWIVRSPLHPCPSTAAPDGLHGGGPVRGCPTDDYLTDEAFQPLRPDGSVTGPAGGLYLPSGSYERFAPDPEAAGGGVAPRAGTFLLRWATVAPCGPTTDCFVGPEHSFWTIEARLDPLPSSPPAPTPQPAPSEARHPGGLPQALDGEPVLVGLDLERRLAAATDATSFLAGGWINGAELLLCSGGIGPSDPNPLGARGCPRHRILGIPGRLYFPPEVRMPEGDGPIVVRVHTHDPAAETCWPELVPACRQRVVVDAVAWFDGPSTLSAPIGPTRAFGALLGAPIGEGRRFGDTIYPISPDLFAMAIDCGPAWPRLAFDVRGDPRLALLLVFADPAARADFQGSTSADRAAMQCRRPTTIERPGEAGWVGHENVLVLTFGDEAFDAGIREVLASILPGTGTTTSMPLPDPAMDRSIEVLTDALDSRAAGSGALLLDGPLVELPIDDEPLLDLAAGWQLDVLRRQSADALDGRFELLAIDPTAGAAGAAWDGLGPNARAWHYRVTYLGATDPALAEEEFVVIHDPSSKFRDWSVVRVSGEPLPRVPRPADAVAEPPLPSDDRTGDPPCLPVGVECGPSLVAGERNMVWYVHVQ